jgi:hypothetical protein
VEIVAWIIMGIVGVCLLLGFIVFLKGTVAKAIATPEYVTCRLKGCDLIDDQRVCIYHGPNNTVDSVWLDPIEYFPKEIQCKYKPNEKKPPTVRETLDAIRKSRK